MRKIILLTLLITLGHFAVDAQVAPPFWRDIVAFKKQDSAQKPPVNPILFVGSSSFTKWLSVREDFPGYVILNRGFGGSTLVDVIRYAYDVILPYQPKQVIVYCGENDLASSENVSAEEVVKRFKTLYSIIRQNLPETTINFVAMKPSPSRKQIFPRLIAANQMISDFLKSEKHAGFIDVYPAMLDATGNPREELYLGDRLHMKPEGYVIWQRIILPYLIK